jgi:cytochrome c
MKPIIATLFAAGLLVCGTASAADMPQVGKNKCGSCHAIDKKLVGPSWNDVAKKYKGDKDAANKIAASIAKGGSFGWKMGSMPPKGLGASDADIKTLADFISKL